MRISDWSSDVCSSDLIDGAWELRLSAAGGERVVRGRALVNAAGPWVTDVLGKVSGSDRKTGLRLVKVSHIIVPRLFYGPQAYILQNSDRRLVFVIPYERAFTLIGTTDVPYDADHGAVATSAEATAILCAVLNEHFDRD